VTAAERIIPEPLMTRRLILRQLDERDIDAIAALGGEWEVASMTGRIPYPYSKALATQWLIGLPEGEFVRAIEFESRFIGIAGYAARSANSAEIGYWIGKPWWGQGFATEAAGAILDHCFGALRFKKMIGCHFVDNSASAAVMTKLGFRRVGPAKGWCEARQSELDTVRYERKRPFSAAWRQGRPR